jgi:hypothetical protein
MRRSRRKKKKVVSRGFKKVIAEFVLIQMLLSFTPAPAFSFDAPTTHKELTNKALELKVKEHEGDKAFLEAFGTLDEKGRYKPTTFGEKIIQGSEEEDYPEPGTPGALISPLLGGFFHLPPLV